MSKAKTDAMEKAKGKMHKTHSSIEYCRHCGDKISSSTRHESGHSEYDHREKEMIKTAN